MLAANNERKLAGFEHGPDDPGDLPQSRRDRLLDHRLAERGNAVLEIRLAPQLLIEQLELVARGQDRARPLGRAAAIADGGLETERNDDGTRLFGAIRIGP